MQLEGSPDDSETFFKGELYLPFLPPRITLIDTQRRVGWWDLGEGIQGTWVLIFQFLSGFFVSGDGNISHDIEKLGCESVSLLVILLVMLNAPIEPSIPTCVAGTEDFFLR